MIETRELPVVAEPTTPIKPSEALRLGRLLRPDRTTDFFFGSPTGACAVGAIHLGWGGEEPTGASIQRIEAEAMDPTLRRLAEAGIDGFDMGRFIFDAAERRGENGDAAVLAFLEERGL